MATGLKVIALISGGKDSLFSILHCIHNGHTVIALANLHPPDHADGSAPEEDLNSYMYQTVGHTVIPLYEDALGIPLYRQEILGSAANTDRDYSAGETKEDETESLVPLLQRVKEAHPDADAISTGAILSTYQRTRVESVALRLGLTPLSYLWQYPYLPPYSQSGLLQDMAAVGQDARIIKVASGGLDEGFLWENVADAKTIVRLRKAMGRFGENGDGAVLGEGGEFETLAIDGPGLLWKKRIEIEPNGVILGDGGNAIFKGKNSRLVGKSTATVEEQESLRIPNIWDSEFKEVVDSISTTSRAPSLTLTSTQTASLPTLPTNLATSTTSTLLISNITSTSSPPGDPSTQLRSILHTLLSHLQTHNLAPASITHATLLLRRMSDFTILNPIYSSIFKAPNPPSRVTVACGDAMPEGVDVMLSAIVSKAEGRRGLHVQSRSYWAPANIGPYSQAICAPLPLSASPSDESDIQERPEVVYIAGQIPLIPASMEVFTEEGFRGQAVLALQHLWRIARVMHVQWWTPGVAYISDCSSDEAESRVQIAQEAWRAIHEHYLVEDEEDEGEDDDIDPWDLKNRHHGFGQPISDTTHRTPIPDSAAVLKGPALAPPAFVVQVSALPRNVDIEWHANGLSKCHIVCQNSSASIHVSNTNSRFFSSEIEIGCTSEDARTRLEDMFGNLASVEWEHVTLYASPQMDGKWAEALKEWKGIQWVPCKGVWGEGGKSIIGLLVGRASVKSVT
jgi:diphthine-ammonia ligase